MNYGIISQGYACSSMPLGLLGNASPVPMPGDPFAYDADAAEYLRRVEAADSQPLEHHVRVAINTFVTSLKGDSIWYAMRACCVMMGARTLAGALTPLIGTAPTNVNFVSGDYNRRTGLLGNGTTKSLNSNRAQNADPQNDFHMSVYITTSATNTGGFPIYIGNYNSTGETQLGLSSATDLLVRNRSAAAESSVGQAATTGLLGFSRTQANWFSLFAGGRLRTFARASQVPNAGVSLVFAGLNVGTGATGLRSASRLCWYSIGASIDLPLLRQRLDRLVADLRIAV